MDALICATGDDFLNPEERFDKIQVYPAETDGAIAIAFDPTKAYGTAMTTVQAFYMALGAADGNEASKFVIAEKRSSGPLSASAITNFYGKLIVPLTLIDIPPIGSDQYRVRYSYVASGAGRCNGESVVRTTKINGMNLIESIKAISDC